MLPCRVSSHRGEASGWQVGVVLRNRSGPYLAGAGGPRPDIRGCMSIPDFLPPTGREPLPLPEKEEIALLPPFERIAMDRIAVVATARAAEAALAEMQGERVLGFDTEAKPTFLKGEVSDGPHVVQFA